MAEHKTRLVAYAPNGAKLGPLPWPLEFSATVPTGELGAASLTYSRAAVGGGLLQRTLTQGLEVALEEWDGSAWVEPRGARFIAVERSFDPSDRTDTVSLKCPAYGWVLTKVKHAAPQEALYSSAEGENQGRRQFLGVNAGTVIKTLRDEYVARGGYAIELGFDTALDSNGVAWPSLNAFWISRGEALDVTLARLYDGGAVDWWWQGRTLHMAPPSAGRERGSVVILRAGREIAEAASTETIADLISAQTLHGGDGVLVTTTEPTAPTPWGRWEGFASDDRVTLAASATARNQQVLAEAGRLRGQYTRDLTPLNPHRLGIDILPGDWIAATTTSTASTERVRVASLLWRAGSQGVTRSLILNDSLLDRELRRQRRERIGSDAGSNGAGSTVRPALEGIDKRILAAPTGLAASTTAYLDNNGVARGLLSASWNPVTAARVADGGGSMEVSGYQLAIRRNVVGAPWAVVRETDDTTVDHAPLTVGEEIQVRVRARGRYAYYLGEWSDAVTLTVASDTTPPPVPSAPTVSARLGVVQVEWDGLAAGGGSGIPIDFARVEVAVGTTSLPTTVRGQILRAGGMALINGLPYNTPHWVRLRAVDQSGNASAWSTAVETGVTPLVDVDLIGSTAMADKLAAVFADFGTTRTNWLKANYIEAGTFRGYVIEGADIKSSAVGDALNFIRLNDRTLTVQRDNGEGEGVVTAQFGGPTSDVMILRNTAGETQSMFDASTGNGSVAGDMSVGDLIVGGDRLQEILDRQPKGILAIHKSAGDSDTAGSAELGYVKLTAQTFTSRMYRFSVEGILAATTAGDRVRVWMKTWNGSAWQSLQMGQWVVPTTTGDAVYLEAVFRGLTNDPSGFYVTFQNATANRGVFWSGRTTYPVTVVLEDLGPAANVAMGAFDNFGGTPLGGGSVTNETGTQTFTKTYSATWYASWRGGSLVTDFLHHGWYGSLQRYSMVGFDATTLAADLSGATVTKAEVYLRNSSWWGSSGTVHVGSATDTSAPAAPVTTGTTANTSMGEGIGRWVPVGGFTASSRSITLGIGADSSNYQTTYGKFLRSGVQLRLTYTR